MPGELATLQLTHRRTPSTQREDHFPSVSAHDQSKVHQGDVYNVSFQRSETALQPSFFKTSSYSSYKDINPERVPGTCVWFLEHPTFKQWKASGGGGLLWLSADPGCGKSVLARALIDERLVGTESSTVCYFFFKDNEEQNNLAGAFCALLHQLFWPNIGLFHKHVPSAVNKCGEALKNDFEELWRLFISAATDPSAGGVICVLDALDECRQPDLDKLIAYLERFYRHVPDNLNGGLGLKFLATSRPYDEIERGFSKLTQTVPTIRLAGEEESDKISHEIGLVIEAKVRDIAEKRGLADDERCVLQRRLSETPNRTYLWLHLTLDEVEKGLGKTQKKLLKVIDTLPRTVEEAYEKILARCKKDGCQDEAMKVLQMIVAAQRPLTVSEIDVALEIENDSTTHEDLDLEGDEGRKEWIRRSCGLFINIVGQSVYLIHQTAREFLVRKTNEMSGWKCWKHSINLQEAHRVLSEKCITYLLFHEIQAHQVQKPAGSRYFFARRSAIRAVTQKYAFLEYSAAHWISHMQRAHVDDPIWVSRAAKLCEVGDGLSCTWFDVYRDRTYLLDNFTQSVHNALYWTAMFGLVNVMRFLLDSGSEPYTQRTRFHPVILAAAENKDHGEELMVLLLGRRGEEVEITEEVVKAAAENEGSGRKIMALLLERRGEEVEITEEVVKAAARNGGSGWEIMALLLKQRGEEVKITEEVVKAAAENEGSGRKIIALLLERRGEEVKITEEVVKAAAKNGRSGGEIMALLLERRGEEVEITEEVLKAAAGNENYGEPVMRMLLDNGGDEINITEIVVETAATCGQLAVLDCLAQHHPLELVQEKWVPIARFYQAAWSSDIETMTELLSAGVPPDLKDTKGRTPLWVAALRGDEALVKLLLQTPNIDINSRSITGRSPIFWPSANGDESTVRLLADAGADPSFPDKDGETALTIAIKNGYEHVAQILRRAIEKNSRDGAP